MAAGQLASNVGDSFYAVALPWYVLATHGSVLLLGSVLAAYGIPRVALITLGGHLSDRWRPWTVMMAADAIRAVAVGTLAGVPLAGPASAALIVPVAAIPGAGEGLFIPGSFAIIPALLPDDDLQAGNALSSAGTQLATMIGPAIGGAVVALAGSAAAFRIDSCSFVISAATLLAVRYHRQAGHDPATALQPDSAGIHTSFEISAVNDATGPSLAAAGSPLGAVIRSEPALQVILALALAANLGSGGLSEVALPALAKGPFHAGASGYGGLIAAFGGGALVGTLIAAQARRSTRPAVAASVAYLLEAGFMAILPYLDGIPPAVAAIAAFGFMNGFANVVTITAFQRWAPPRLLGRLMGLIMTSSFGVFPISVLIGSAIVHTCGPEIFFPLAATALALAVLTGLTQPSWRNFGAVNGC